MTRRPKIRKAPWDVCVLPRCHPWHRCLPCGKPQRLHSRACLSWWPAELTENRPLEDKGTEVGRKIRQGGFQSLPSPPATWTPGTMRLGLRRGPRNAGRVSGRRAAGTHRMAFLPQPFHLSTSGNYATEATEGSVRKFKRWTCTG